MSFSLVGFFILTLTILVFVHELGHFWVARRCGVKVLTFSIGFGPVIFRKLDRYGTEWCISALPLGGYVRMLDDRDAVVAKELHRECFTYQPSWAKAAIVAAGPLANFILAVLLYSLVNWLGVTHKVPVVGEVRPHTPAFYARFERGQKILAVNDVEVTSVYALNLQLAAQVGETGDLSFDLQSQDVNAVTSVSIPVTRWLKTQQRPNFYRALGFELYYPDSPAVIAEVLPSSVGSRAGIMANDTLIAINGLKVKHWPSAIEMIAGQPNKTLRLDLLRAGELIQLQLVTEAVKNEAGKTVGRIGVKAMPVDWPEDLLLVERFSLFAAIEHGFIQTYEMIAFTLGSMKKLIMGLISPANLGGPISIAKMATASAGSGFIPFLSFLGLLSVSLGVLNLLPIPALDGGQLLTISVEAILNRPLPDWFLLWFQQLGLLLILSIMLLAIFNDVKHF
ncbi:MAG: RIP metalloprotease RseP [Pseudomonadales bacterium]|nr:RIP metalloprotease RseP [Pseudomonadales bacterium]